MKVTDNLFDHHHPFVRALLRGHTKPRTFRGDVAVFVLPVVVVTLKQPVTVLSGPHPDDVEIRIRALSYLPSPRLGPEMVNDGFVMVDPVLVMTVKRNAWLDDGTDLGTHLYEYEGDAVVMSNTNVLSAVSTERFSAVFYDDSRNSMMLFNALFDGDVLDDPLIDDLFKSYERGRSVG